MKDHRIFAASYDFMLRSIERRSLARRRLQLLEGLGGRVLDVGAGTGANLPYFAKADHVTLAEPDGAMRAKMAAKLDAAAVPVELSDAAAEQMPFPDASFDAVVCTLVLCTVDDPDRALAEIRRVLAPGGTLVLLEHVLAPDGLARWQRRVQPVWHKLAAGCHLDRDTAANVERAGFTLTSLEHIRELPRWVLISPMIQATAVRA